MDYLSVEEAAVLKNCSARYIRKQCKNGVLPAVLREHPQNHKPCYQIPVSAFPEPLQARYYQQKRQEMGMMPTPISAETKPQKPKKRAKAVRQMTIEDCTAQQRQEIQIWTASLLEWHAGRIQYSKKTDYDKLYVGKCQLEHPDLQVSTGILYRKWNAYQEHDLAGMLGIRGGWNKHSSGIPQVVWEAFLWFWLDENQPTVRASYRNVISWTEDFHPELVACIPSERSFRRRIDNDVAEATKILMREGEKAFSDRCMPYIIAINETSAFINMYLIFKADEVSSVFDSVDILQQVNPKLLRLSLFVTFIFPVFRKFLCSFLLLFFCNIHSCAFLPHKLYLF